RADECFFFQAEDGIRAFHVTGVQTCALPIFSAAQHPIFLEYARANPNILIWSEMYSTIAPVQTWPAALQAEVMDPLVEASRALEIGRASGRDRVRVGVLGGAGRRWCEEGERR